MERFRSTGRAQDAGWSRHANRTGLEDLVNLAGRVDVSAVAEFMKELRKSGEEVKFDDLPRGYSRSHCQYQARIP